MHATSSPYYNKALSGLSAIEASIEHLIKQVDYLNADDQRQLIDSCFFAANAHNGQKRRSGEPYICHPIKVAEILANEVRFNLPVLQAAVLHDVIEDTSVEKAEVITAFSNEVADLVDGVSKLEKDKNVSPQELQARTFHKLVVAMEADPRVVMIKFADRMHNMQTLGALSADKRRRIARETLEVYVPIATRLGMFNFKSELEELAFQHMHPWRYHTIKKLLQNNAAREKAMLDVEQTLQQAFLQENIQASIRRRRRNLYHIYTKLKKMRFKRRPLARASIPFIIITNSIEDCYRALGLIHQIYTPVFKKLNDYIALPKVNGYQSLHTSVLTEDRRVINLQIRTKAMHTIAESGIIAIWREHNKSENTLGVRKLPPDKSMRRWLGNIKNLGNITTNPVEFYEAVKRDLIGFEMQVLTPKGEPVALPEGATVIDFAYHIHTDIGDHLHSAQVNGVDVPVDFALSNGQTVEIFTNAGAAPNNQWIKYAKTERARTAIRHYLQDADPKILQAMGQQTLKRYLARHHIKYRHLDELLQQVARRYNTSLGELLQRIALYRIPRRAILNALQAVAGKYGISTTVQIDVINQPGTLATVAETIGKHDANILRIDFPKNMQADEIAMTLELHLHNYKQLAPIIDALNQLSLVKQATHVKHEETVL